MLRPRRAAGASALAGLVLLLATIPATSAPGIPAAEERPTREQALAVLRPYTGDSAAVTDRSTLTGKVMCGYQGWFTAPGDGSGKGWSHYASRGTFAPGSCCIDLWPDVVRTRRRRKIRHAVPPRRRLASPASSARTTATTVLRHFRWMREYGIDGVFVQRFAVETIGPAGSNHCNVVLDACREGANREGRAYAVMYDLSGLPAGGVDTRDRRLETAGRPDAARPRRRRQGLPPPRRQAGRRGLGRRLQRRAEVHAGRMPPADRLPEERPEVRRQHRHARRPRRLAYARPRRRRATRRCTTSSRVRTSSAPGPWGGTTHPEAAGRHGRDRWRRTWTGAASARQGRTCRSSSPASVGTT